LLRVGPGQRTRIPLVGAHQRPPTETRTSRISASHAPSQPHAWRAQPHRHAAESRWVTSREHTRVISRERRRLEAPLALLRLRREGEVIRGSVSHLCWARRQWRRAPLRGQAAKRPTEAVIGTREGDDMTEDTLMIQVRCRTCRTSERRLFLRGAVAPDNRNHMTPTWTSAAPYQHGGAREAGFK